MTLLPQKKKALITVLCIVRFQAYVKEGAVQQALDAAAAGDTAQPAPVVVVAIASQQAYHDGDTAAAPGPSVPGYGGVGGAPSAMRGEAAHLMPCFACNSTAERTSASHPMTTRPPTRPPHACTCTPRL